MILTRHNYHSNEANNAYLSKSQYDSFLTCEAATMAALAGEWFPEKPTAFLVGSYVHSWCEGTLADFIAEHPECFLKNGGLKAEFRQAEEMIRTLEADPFVMHALTGEQEVVMTAEIGGYSFKGMFDVYVPGKRIVDLKTTKSIRDLQWSAEHGGKVTFIEQYHYFRQVAIYLEIERINAGRPEGEYLDFYMVAVSKENVPDKEVINLTDHERVAAELAKIKVDLPRITAVKSGRVSPVGCGCCEYCRSVKRITRAIHYMELEL